MTEKFPYELRNVDPELNDDLVEAFCGFKEGFVQVIPSMYIMPSEYIDSATKLYNIIPRADDIWVSTFPRSGTTLMQELVWLLANNLDYDTAAKLSLNNRFSFTDMNFLMPKELVNMCEELRKDEVKLKEQPAHMTGLVKSLVSTIESDPSPRMIKTHMPFSLLHPTLIDTSKVVYVARNPKDVAVSYYYHNRFFTGIGFKNQFSKYWHYFQRDLVHPCPFWEHMREAWELKDHPNMLFFFYEDIVQDWSGTIQKVAKFLNKEISDEDVSKLAEHMHIDNFRKNPSVNMEMDHFPGTVDKQFSFIRKGENQGWKAEFSEELSAEADLWIKENMLKIPGFAFPMKSTSKK